MRFGTLLLLVLGITGCRTPDGGVVLPPGPDSVGGAVDMARAPAPDLARAPDQQPGADMAQVPPSDLAEPAPGPDLAEPPVADMARQPDLAKPPVPDMTPPPADMTQLPDLTPPPPACGGLGQVCCDNGGDACNASNHNCVEGVCKSCMGGKCYTCGTDWLPPCPGNTCEPGYVWVGDQHGGGQCLKCGLRGQWCCNPHPYVCPPSPNACWTGTCVTGTCNGTTLLCQ